MKIAKILVTAFALMLTLGATIVYAAEENAVKYLYEEGIVVDIKNVYDYDNNGFVILRQLNLHTSDGYIMVDVPMTTPFIENGKIENFDQLHIGDKIRVNYNRLVSSSYIYPSQIRATIIQRLTDYEAKNIYIDLFHREGNYLVGTTNGTRIYKNEHITNINRNNDKYDENGNKMVIIYENDINNPINIINSYNKTVTAREYEQPKTIINMLDLLPPAARGTVALSFRHNNHVYDTSYFTGLEYFDFY